MADKKEEDSWISKISSLLTWKSMMQIAVEYMGFTVTDLLVIADEAADQKQDKKQMFLINVKNSYPDHKKRLASYLTQSGLVDSKKVERILGPGDASYKKCTSGSTGNFPSLILGELAKVIATRHMENIALGYLGFTIEQVQDTRFNNIRDSELFNLAILEKYALETKDTLEDMKEKLMRSSKECSYVDGNKVTKIFDQAIKHVTADPQEAKGATSSMTQNKQPVPKKLKTEGPSGPAAKTGILGLKKSKIQPKKPIGNLLIINNQTFNNSDYNREGSEIDVERLKKVFADRGFVPIVLPDLSAKMMIAAVKVFVKKDKLTADNVEMFKRQFQLDDEVIEDLKELKEGELRQVYNFSTDVIDELKGDFDSIGQEEFENGLMEKLCQQLKPMLEKEDTTELNKKLSEPEKRAIQGEYKKLGREAFRKRYSLTNINIVDELLDFFQREAFPLSKAKSQIVVIMSHGDNGKITGVDEEDVKLDILLNEFNSENCLDLESSEKLFLIQACRGDAIDYQRENPKHRSILKRDFPKLDNKKVTPCFADILVGYSSHPGQASFLGTYGSAFIQNTCKVFDDMKDDEDVLSASMKINERMAGVALKDLPRDPQTNKKVAQMCEFKHTMRKPWILPKTGKTEEESE